MSRPEFFGVRLRRKALRTGLLSGVLISGILVAWLLVANHMPQFQAYAAARNILCGVLTILVMAIPVLRFLRQPATMFVSGLTAWILLTLTYMAMETRYSLLASRMGALQVFMLGAVSYGFISVLQWVFVLCLEARHRHVTQPTVPEPTRRTP